MNKRIVLIGITFSIIIFSVFIVFIINKADNIKTITKYTGKNAFQKIENMFEEKELTYDYVVKVGTNYGALNLIQYSLSDGTVIEIYEFVEKSVVYDEILNTGRLYLLGTNTSYNVSVVKELNIAIRYLNEGKRIETIKETLK